MSTTKVATILCSWAIKLLNSRHTFEQSGSGPCCPGIEDRIQPSNQILMTHPSPGRSAHRAVLPPPSAFPTSIPPSPHPSKPWLNQLGQKQFTSWHPWVGKNPHFSPVPIFVAQTRFTGHLHHTLTGASESTGLKGTLACSRKHTQCNPKHIC